MGTTLNKLQYLDETKGQIKTALNQFNAGITDEDTFRSYVDKINDIYDNWEKVTGEGTDVTLNNTKNGKIVLTPKGNTSQSGTPTPDSPQPIEVVTGTQEVKVENVNLANETNIQIGKAWNEASNNARAIWQIPILPNTTYTISYTDKSGLDGLFRYQKINYNDSSASVGVAEITTSPTTFTSASNSYWLGLQFNKSNITLADIQAVKIQVEKGSSATTYTPHQEQTQTISLGDIELCKKDNHQDYLYKSNDKWYKKGVIQKISGV